MVSKAVIILSVSTALFAIGFLSSTTVLFTLCCDLMFGRPCAYSQENYASGNEEPPVKVPDFFLSYGPDANDSAVNGSTNQWLCPGGVWNWLGTSLIGYPLIGLDPNKGTVSMRIVGVLSGGFKPSVLQIFVNTGNDTFATSDSICGQYVWTRVSYSTSDLEKISCTANFTVQPTWAFVATWINFEESSFQFAFACSIDGSCVIVINYGDLNSAHEGNKFGTLYMWPILNDTVHVEAGSLPSNKQLLWDLTALDPENITSVSC